MTITGRRWSFCFLVSCIFVQLRARNVNFLIPILSIAIRTQFARTMVRVHETSGSLEVYHFVPLNQTPNDTFLGEVRKLSTYCCDERVHERLCKCEIITRVSVVWELFSRGGRPSSFRELVPTGTSLHSNCLEIARFAAN